MIKLKKPEKPEEKKKKKKDKGNKEGAAVFASMPNLSFFVAQDQEKDKTETATTAVSNPLITQSPLRKSTRRTSLKSSDQDTCVKKGDNNNTASTPSAPLSSLQQQNSVNNSNVNANNNTNGEASTTHAFGGNTPHYRPASQVRRPRIHYMTPRSSEFYSALGSGAQHLIENHKPPIPSFDPPPSIGAGSSNANEPSAEVAVEPQQNLSKPPPFAPPPIPTARERRGSVAFYNLMANGIMGILTVGEEEEFKNAGKEEEKHEVYNIGGRVNEAGEVVAEEDEEIQEEEEEEDEDEKKRRKKAWKKEQKKKEHKENKESNNNSNNSNNNHHNNNNKTDSSSKLEHSPSLTNNRETNTRVSIGNRKETNPLSRSTGADSSSREVSAKRTPVPVPVPVVVVVPPPNIVVPLPRKVIRMYFEEGTFKTLAITSETTVKEITDQLVKKNISTKRSDEPVLKYSLLLDLDPTPLTTSPGGSETKEANPNITPHSNPNLETNMNTTTSTSSSNSTSSNSSSSTSSNSSNSSSSSSTSSSNLNHVNNTVDQEKNLHHNNNNNSNSSNNNSNNSTNNNNNEDENGSTMKISTTITSVEKLEEDRNVWVLYNEYVEKRGARIIIKPELLKPASSSKKKKKPVKKVYFDVMVSELLPDWEKYDGKTGNRREGASVYLRVHCGSTRYKSSVEKMNPPSSSFDTPPPTNGFNSNIIEDNIVFNDYLTFTVDENAVENLFIKVYYTTGSRLSKDEEVGTAIIPLPTINDNLMHDLWVFYNHSIRTETIAYEEKRGRLHVVLQKTTKPSAGLFALMGTPIPVIPLRLQVGDAVLFRSSTMVSHGTKLATRSKWDHAAIVVKLPGKKTLSLFEATRDGVKIYPLSLRLEFYLETTKLGVRKLHTNRTKEMLKALEDFVEEVAGRPYKTNVMEIGRALLGGSNTQDNLENIFCSQLVAAAYQRMGLLDSKVSTNNFLPSDIASKKFELEIGKLKPVMMVPKTHNVKHK